MLGLAVAFAMLTLLVGATDRARFPNGAELRRKMEWGKLFQNGFPPRMASRGDLYLPDGRLISRDVDFLCWTQTAVSGSGRPQAFVWPGGDSPVIMRTIPNIWEPCAEAACCPGRMPAAGHCGRRWARNWCWSGAPAGVMMPPAVRDQEPMRKAE